LCMSIRYSLIVYYVLIAIAFLCTLISAYIIKYSKIVDPHIGILPKKAKSNVLIFVPAYSENKSTLENTFESVLLNDYPINSKTLIVVVDGCIKGEGNDDTTSNYTKQILNVGTNISFNKNYKVHTGWYKQMKYILVIKSINGGKKDSFIFVKKCLYYSLFTSKINMNDDFHFYKSIGKFMENISYILMLDTDTKIDSSGITSLVNYLESDIKTAAVCGETSLIRKTENFVVMSQYFEYYITHYTLKALENVFGNVLVLSGCFTLYRKDILVNKELISKYSKEEKDTLLNANVTLLGEDRYLTNLIIKLYPNLNTRYTEKAKCYTQVPTDFNTLMCQRRRWSNSMIFCHLKLLCDLPKYNILKKFIFSSIIIFELWLALFMPLLICIGYYYTIVFLINPPYNNTSIIFTSIFINIPIIMCIFLRKFNMIKYAFVFQFILPFFSVIIPIYSIFLCDNISWGKTRKIQNCEPSNKNKSLNASNKSLNASNKSLNASNVSNASISRSINGVIETIYLNERNESLSSLSIRCATPEPINEYKIPLNTFQRNTFHRNTINIFPSTNLKRNESSELLLPDNNPRSKIFY
jgi:cellulose synthase/poly-beta-1,6-N-acetylglucosamine synthase-like glycosyltransferase